MIENNKTAAVYIRFAHYNDDELLLEHQRTTLRDFAEKQGFDDIREYIDNGYSGSNLDRPAFMQMETDIKAGEVDAVIVRDISRIARNFLLVESWLGGLEAYNVKFIAADGSHEQPDVTSGFRKWFSEWAATEQLNAVNQ